MFFIAVDVVCLLFLCSVREMSQSPIPVLLQFQLKHYVIIKHIDTKNQQNKIIKLVCDSVRLILVSLY